MRTANFPFDEQECLLIISPWGYTARQVTVYDSGSSINLSGNSEWSAEGKFSRENIVDVQQNRYKELHYIIRLKRNPSYYVWVLIVPTYLITCLSIAGIFMPNSSGDERIEKVTLGLATLMTMAIILNIVSEAMPKGADLPLLGHFVMAEIILCLVSLVLSIGIIQVHHRVSTRTCLPPEWLATLLFLPRFEHLVEASHDKQQFPDSKKKAFRQRSIGEQRSFKRELTNAWTVNLNQLATQATKSEKSTPQPDFFDDLRQLVIESKTYLNKLNHIDAVVHDWVRIFGRIDTLFFISFQIINFIMTTLILY
uniref:Uncharacterized protein n=1 Tax=Plectus sambesii TaxID=2011161 RepID=A0A914VFH2_9BILA